MERMPRVAERIPTNGVWCVTQSLRGEAIPVSRPELVERRSHLSSGTFLIPAKTMSFSYCRVRFPLTQCGKIKHDGCA